MKEVDGCTSVDGENFASALTDGCLYSPPDSEPFRRGLAWIEARKGKQLALHPGDFLKYDGTDTVNQG